MLIVGGDIDAEVCTHVTGQVLLPSLPAVVKNTLLHVLICGAFLVLLADVSYRLIVPVVFLRQRAENMWRCLYFGTKGA